jgi:hypothetical protein
MGKGIMALFGTPLAHEDHQSGDERQMCVTTADVRGGAS